MATINDMLDGVQTALTVSLFPKNNVFYAFDPPACLAYPPGDNFVAIQPNSLKVSQITWGKGPATNIQNTKQTYLWKLDFTIWLFVRLATDEAHRDVAYLSDLTYGSAQLTDQVINTLQNYTVVAKPENIAYQLDSVQWQSKDRDTLGWGSTKLFYQTNLTSRSN